MKIEDETISFANMAHIIGAGLSGPRSEHALAKYVQKDGPDNLIMLSLAHTVRHVGDIHQDAGEVGLAEPCYVESITIYRNHEQTEPLDLANAIRPLAILKADAGEIEAAKLLWAEARDLYAVANVREGVAESSRRLARLEAR